jgi:regulatory protein
VREKRPPNIKKPLKLTGSLAEARHYALKLLHFRSRSEKEMIDRLKRKGFDDTQINNTMEYLQNAGLIKDEALAPELLKHAIEKKYLGRKGIKVFLSSRGLKKDLIDETLSDFSEDVEKEAALRLVEKKMKVLRNYPEDVIKRRLWGMLQRRGFSAEIINKAIKSIKL